MQKKKIIEEKIQKKDKKDPERKVNIKPNQDEKWSKK